MMEDHRILIEKAEKAVTDLFSDTSVPQSTTKEDLETLVSQIEDMLNTLNEQ